jgi:hypothetical protein
MDREEAQRKVREIRRILTGHPPGDPVEKLGAVMEILGTSKKRKATRGRDREEKGGRDRSE